MADIQIAQERVPERDFTRGKHILVVVCIIQMRNVASEMIYLEVLTS